MSNIFDSVTEKLGLDKDGITEKATGLLDQHRDQIPDGIEGKIDEALHGGALGGLLDKVGMGGHKEEESEEEEETTKEVSTEEEASDDSEEESDEEASDDDTEQ